MWVLTVCIGVLWGGMCDQTFRYVYPTEAACVFEMDRVNAKVRDGYAKCSPKPEVEKK